MTSSPFAEVAERLFADLAGGGGDDAVARWSAVDDIELDRLLVPEAEGGAGDAFEDACAVMSTFGRHGLGLPLLETMVANWLLAHSGQSVGPGMKALMTGSDLGALRLENGRLAPPPDPMPVVWFPLTPTAVVLAEDETGVLQVATLARPAGGRQGKTVADEPVQWVDGADLVLASPPQPLLRPRPLAEALPVLLQAAAMTGAIEVATGMTLEHANLRRQFGRPIASFQAVQHMAARMASAGAMAAASVENGKRLLLTPEALWFAAIAKSATSEAAGIVAADAHQIHGAIGFTREYQLHRHTRRLWAWRERYGNEEHWNFRMGKVLLKPRDTTLWEGICDGVSI